MESAEVGLERQGYLPSRLSPRRKTSTRQSAGWSGGSEGQLKAFKAFSAGRRRASEKEGLQHTHPQPDWQQEAGWLCAQGRAQSRDHGGSCPHLTALQALVLSPVGRGVSTS